MTSTRPEPTAAHDLPAEIDLRLVVTDMDGTHEFVIAVGDRLRGYR